MARTLSVEEVQEQTSSLRAELASIAERLRVLQGAVEPHLPVDREADEMTAGTRPTSVPWEVHGWLGEAESAVRDAAETLDEASAATADTLLADWLRRLCDGKDRTAFAVLSIELRDSPVQIPDGADEKSVFRALVVQMAEELYRQKTGGRLKILRRLRKGYRWTRGVKVYHITQEGAGSSLCGRGKGPDVGGDNTDARAARRTCKACWSEYPDRRK